MISSTGRSCSEPSGKDHPVMICDNGQAPPGGQRHLPAAHAAAERLLERLAISSGHEIIEYGIYRATDEI